MNCWLSRGDFLNGHHGTPYNDIQHTNKLEATLSIKTLSIINGSVVMLSVTNKTNMLCAVMLSVKVPLNWIS